MQGYILSHCLIRMLLVYIGEIGNRQLGMSLCKLLAFVLDSIT